MIINTFHSTDHAQHCHIIKEGYKTKEAASNLLKSGWYLVRSKPKGECTAITHLTSQCVTVYCPYLDLTEKKQPMFPGYLFVYLSADPSHQYHCVRYSPGVSDFVSFNISQASKSCLPQPIPNGDRIIADVKEIARQQSLQVHLHQPTATLSPGDRVTLKNELFKDLIATFIRPTNTARGLILLSYIQKIRRQETVITQSIAEKTIELPLSQMDKADGSKK